MRHRLGPLIVGIALALVSCGQILGADKFGPLRVDAAAGGGGSASASSSGGSAPSCGDGVKNLDEVCDGSDLGELSCASEVAPGWVGALGCLKTCTPDDTECQTPPTAYRDLTAPNWSAFDLTAVHTNAKGFAAAAFDGRYVYLVPYWTGVYHGLVTRYDTGSAFTMASSWSTFDVATVTPSGKGFFSAAFDGRYLYLAPFQTGDMTFHGTVARYDTKATFTSPLSWSIFDTVLVNPDARGFIGSAFDGRYLYLVPYNNGVTHGHVTRFDTKASFATASSWSVFDTTSVNTAAKGFAGTSFDGRFLYLVPLEGGVVARLDTTASFEAQSSWSVFDLQVNKGLKGFAGGAFDGRYLYLAPTGGSGVVARFDTHAPFESQSSWTTFNVATVHIGAKGFHGASFDGRYLYLVPFNNGAFDGVVARYDTTLPFAMGSSWSVFDVASLNFNARGFIGGAFDGRYLYLTPYYNGTPASVVMRFDAKTPAWLPRGWHASYY